MSIRSLIHLPYLYIISLVRLKHKIPYTEEKKKRINDITLRSNWRINWFLSLKLIPNTATGPHLRVATIMRWFEIYLNQKVEQSAHLKSSHSFHPIYYISDLHHTFYETHNYLNAYFSVSNCFSIGLPMMETFFVALLLIIMLLVQTPIKCINRWKYTQWNPEIRYSMDFDIGHFIYLLCLFFVLNCLIWLCENKFYVGH